MHKDSSLVQSHVWHSSVSLIHWISSVVLDVIQPLPMYPGDMANSRGTSSPLVSPCSKHVKCLQCLFVQLVALASKSSFLTGNFDTFQNAMSRDMALAESCTNIPCPSLMHVLGTAPLWYTVTSHPDGDNDLLLLQFLCLSIINFLNWTCNSCDWVIFPNRCEILKLRISDLMIIDALSCTR